MLLYAFNVPYLMYKYLLTKMFSMFPELFVVILCRLTNLYPPPFVTSDFFTSRFLTNNSIHTFEFFAERKFSVYLIHDGLIRIEFIEKS